MHATFPLPAASDFPPPRDTNAGALVLTNMPIQRFGSTLVSKGTLAGCMRLLRESYRAHLRDLLRLHPLVEPIRIGAAITAGAVG